MRKKKNKSGVVSIQVIDKSSGNYKMIKTIGSSSDPIEINLLYQQGLDYIQHFEGQKTIDFTDQNFKDTVKQSIKNISIEGIHLLLGKIYSEIGFDNVCNDLLKQLVLVRLSPATARILSCGFVY